jgi:phosphatidate cytidylyltransferase
MSNNFLKRTITSIILLAILLIVNYSHHFVFMISIAIVGGIVCFEASDISSKLVGPLFTKHNKKDSFALKINYKYLLISVVVFIYIFFIFGQYSYEVYRLESPTFFLYLVSICFLTDIGGYLFGKTIGGRKLTKISPNKTISGTIGSFVFSILPLIVFSNLSIIDLEFTLKNIIFVLLVSLVSQLGDLFISYFKRKAKIKDTGKILPGHGGALDRVDGVVFALPFSYFLLKFI